MLVPNTCQMYSPNLPSFTLIAFIFVLILSNVIYFDDGLIGFESVCIISATIDLNFDCVLFS